MSSFFQSSPRTESLTVLLTDIKGYTARTASQSREESASWLGTHEAILEPVVTVFGGTRRKDIGDAWLVTFTSPTDAVRCAMAIQDRLWAYNRHAEPADRIDVRAVLTLGEVQLRKGELIGEAVTAALALDGIADASEVVLTESVYLSMNRTEAPTEEMGRSNVEGLPESVLLYRAARVTHGDDGPPYGNRTLPPPPQLDTIDKDWVASRLEGGEAADAAAPNLPRDLRAVGRRIRGALGPVREAAGDQRTKRALFWAGGGFIGVLFLSLLLATVLGALGGGPVKAIERLVDQDEIEEAREAIGELARERPDGMGDVHYLRGYLAWHEELPVRAAAAYRHAIEDTPEYATHDTIAKHMLAALEDEGCGARRAAAGTLALTGREDVIEALRSALAKERERSRGARAIRRLRCDFEGAAERAIEVLEQGGAPR